MSRESGGTSALGSRPSRATPGVPTTWTCDVDFYDDRASSRSISRGMPTGGPCARSWASRSPPCRSRGRTAPKHNLCPDEASGHHGDRGDQFAYAVPSTPVARRRRTRTRSLLRAAAPTPGPMRGLRAPRSCDGSCGGSALDIELSHVDRAAECDRTRKPEHLPGIAGVGGAHDVVAGVAKDRLVMCERRGELDRCATGVGKVADHVVGSDEVGADLDEGAPPSFDRYSPSPPTLTSSV